MTDTVDIPKNPKEFINKLFSSSDSQLRRKCLYQINHTGGGIDRKSPVYCNHNLATATSSGNYAKHLCTHIKSKEGSYESLKRDIRKHYPNVADQQLGQAMRKRSLLQTVTVEESTVHTSAQASPSINDNQPSKKARQSTIEESLQHALDEDFLKKLAICFAATSWAHLVADMPEFRDMLDAYRIAKIGVPGRDSVPGLIATRKAHLKDRLTNRLIADSPRYPVTIAFDA